MAGFKGGKNTGKSHSHGDESIGGLLGTMSSFSEKSVPGNRKVPKFSHPGPGNGSGSVGAGKVMTARTGLPGGSRTRSGS